MNMNMNVFKAAMITLVIIPLLILLCTMFNFYLVLIGVISTIFVFGAAFLSLEAIESKGKSD